MRKDKTKRPAPPAAAPPPAPEPSGSRHTATLLQLALLAVLLFLLRKNMLDIPLERDESTYAYLGKCALEGQAPYRDFYEMKPPLLFYAYAGLIKLFGYSHAGLHWAALFLAFLNTLSVYFIAGLLFSPAFRLWAGLSYVLLMSNPYTTAPFLESELVVMAFVLPGVYCLLRGLYASEAAARSRLPWLLGAGALLAAGTLVKQSGVYFFGFAAVTMCLRFFYRGRAGLLADGAAFALGVLLPVAACALLLQAFGVWKEFGFWNIDYVRLYASTISRERGWQVFQINLKALSKNFVLYWVAAALGLAAMLFSRGNTAEKRWTLAAFAVFSFLAVTPGNRFYHHYWLHFLPALALLMTAFFFALHGALSRFFSAKPAKMAYAGLAGLLLALPVLQNTGLFLSPNYARIVRALFSGNPCYESKLLADYVARQIKPDERIAVLGSEPQYYVYLNKKSPSRHFYMAFLSRPTEFSEVWQKEALDSLQRQKPEYAVFNFVPYSWMMKKESSQFFYSESYTWCRLNYEPIGWVVMKDLDRPEIYLDAAARRYEAPKDGTSFILLLKRKAQPPPG